MEHSAVIHLPDEILRLSLMGGQARVMLCRTTAITQSIEAIHQPSPTALCALSRLMTGTALISAQMKQEDASVTVTVAGDGPGGRATAVGQNGTVKVTMDHPEIDVPLRNGAPDVGALLGRQGRLTVIKDTGLKEPYIGQTELVTGDLGDDFAQYFTVSEQVPSLVALGALVYEGHCLSAGGVLVQAMPGCTEEALELLEMRSVFFSYISREVADMSLEDLAKLWFDGMDMQVLAKEPIRHQCDCSRERMEKALIALGRSELTSLICEDEQATLTCHFCRMSHYFSKADLQNLLERATR